ncbi:unnamed protein product [Mytilus coruscus]|uniref:Peptidase A2 domain-containing protein n=1 Tax=Mytilus coruscus TaxID=42192 RepID=A0A6J8BK27_MYTCO|nr:unnamed protein product [Mytilus coruscus]
MSRMSSNEPQHRLPAYNGKDEWESFWCQFQIISRRYAWDNHKQATQLLLCLKDEALNFASRLPNAVQTDIFSLFVELKKRFGDNILPSTHRAALQDLHKQNKESLQEFAYRVVNLINKAYPEITGIQLFEELTVEHFLYGLNDENMTYDVISKQPKSIDEALNMVMWHESCRSRNGKTRKTSIREVHFDSQCEENDVRRLHQKQYVTEERLNQFGRELKDSIIDGMANLNKKLPSLPNTNKENCLKRKFATSEKNSSEKHHTTEGLGPSSSDVKIISKKSDQCRKNKHIEKPVLSRVDAVNQYRDDINEKTIALTSGILPEKHFEDYESSVDSVDGENSLKAVIDTGAEVTVLSEKVYRNLAKEHHLELKTATRGLLVAKEGEKMSATGITEMEMSLGPLRFTWPVYVAPLNGDLLLGCDIIDKMDITVNTKRGIQIKDIWYPCEVKRRE